MKHWIVFRKLSFDTTIILLPKNQVYLNIWYIIKRKNAPTKNGRLRFCDCCKKYCYYLDNLKHQNKLLVSKDYKRPQRKFQFSSIFHEVACPVLKSFHKLNPVKAPHRTEAVLHSVINHQTRFYISISFMILQSFVRNLLNKKLIIVHQDACLT